MRFGSRKIITKRWEWQGRIPETSLQCIQYLRQSYPLSRISVEVERPAREGLRALAAEADVVFYSRSWAEVSRMCISETDQAGNHEGQRS